MAPGKVKRVRHQNPAELPVILRHSIGFSAKTRGYMTMKSSRDPINRAQLKRKVRGVHGQTPGADVLHFIESA